METTIKQSAPIRVLVVEDEFLISEFVAEVLTEQGFAVQLAGNAAEALRRLTVDTVDVLVTDINLPGDMDGAALARRARQLQPNLPVVYASARADTLALGARVPGGIMVPKPYEPALIGRLITAAWNSAACCVPA